MHTSSHVLWSSRDWLLRKNWRKPTKENVSFTDLWSLSIHEIHSGKTDLTFLREISVDWTALLGVSHDHHHHNKEHQQPASEGICRDNSSIVSDRRKQTQSCGAVCTNALLMTKDSIYLYLPLYLWSFKDIDLIMPALFIFPYVLVTSLKTTEHLKTLFFYSFLALNIK